MDDGDICDEDDGNVEDVWKLLLLIPISEPILFLTNLSSKSPYLSWLTITPFLEESMIFLAEVLFDVVMCCSVFCYLRNQKVSD